MRPHLLVATLCLLLPLPPAAADLLPSSLNKNVSLLQNISGFPDCVRIHPDRPLRGSNAEKDLSCAPRPSTNATAIKVACVGDSITAGARASGPEHVYPAQLQRMLDAKYGRDAYSVTNLGASGATLMKRGNSPFWHRPQFAALVRQDWDVVAIMLGTNDAKDRGDRGPPNWPHDCAATARASLAGCSFAADYKALIDVVRNFGTTPAGPKIYLLIPPPLMKNGSIGANQTVINSLYPRLVPLIAKAHDAVAGTIDVFKGMGGVTDWSAQFPRKGCARHNSTWAPCQWWCDQQSCDQCHPNNAGYHQLASVVFSELPW